MNRKMYKMLSLEIENPIQYNLNRNGTTNDMLSTQGVQGNKKYLKRNSTVNNNIYT